MPALELRFLAGRYHATAWGRNVNEGEPEWPPSPFRIARALLDIWYRRRPDIDVEDMQAALTLLAGQPDMALPEMRPVAVKQYLDQNEREEKKQAALDAFAVMERGARVCLRLPPDAPEAALTALRRLAPELNYLGRSESWVAARVLDAEPSDIVWNCRAKQEGEAAAGEPLPCNCLADAAEYDRLPIHPTTGDKKKQRPCDWLEALSLSSADLQTAGWNRHPLARPCVYHIAAETRRRRPSPESRQAETGLCFTYALRAAPLPAVTRTLPLAERVRIGLMSRHRHICGGDPAKVSGLFSGKDRDGRPLQGHRHAFFWPLDLDGDGKLDHIRVIAPNGVDDRERAALESLRKIWDQTSDLADLTLLHALPLDSLETATAARSVTPVIFGRHYKKRCGSWQAWLEGEIRRSCREMSLPEPQTVECDPDAPKWREFIRNRKDAPPQPGFGFRLTFATPVRAPFALGSLAHFGLGVFVASGE